VFWIIFSRSRSCTSRPPCCSDAGSPRRGWRGPGSADGRGRHRQQLRRDPRDSSVMFTSYAPMGAPSDVLISADPVRGRGPDRLLRLPRNTRVAKNEKTYHGSVPLVHLRAVTACIIAIFTIAVGRDHPDPDLSVVARLINYIDSLMYRTVWWGFGHSSQQITYRPTSQCGTRSRRSCSARTHVGEVSRGAFPPLHLLPALASGTTCSPIRGSRRTGRSSTPATATVPRRAGVDGPRTDGAGLDRVAQREKGFNKGLFEWLRKAPWSNPSFLAMSAR